MSSPSRLPSLVSVTSSTWSTSDQDFKLDPQPKNLIAPAEHMIPSGSMDGSRSCLQTDKALEEWEEFKAWKKQHADLQAASTGRPSDPCSDHERFFLPAQNIFFLVSSTFYSVPRAPFEWHSSAFTGKGLSRDDPFILDDIKAAQFDHFLSILYPYAYGVYTANTVEEWTTILHLANKWRFKSIRTLAVKHLASIATDIDKIILGRQYAIEAWLGDAYLALCLREQSLSKEEGQRLEKEDIIDISAIRQNFGFGGHFKVAHPTLIAEVCARFGLVDSDLSHTGLACIAPEASLTSGSTITTPLVCSGSPEMHSTHLGKEQSMPTLNAQVSLPYGGDSVLPPEPAMAPKGAGAAEDAREEAVLERAETAKDIEIAEWALRTFIETPLYAESDEAEQYRLRCEGNMFERQLEELQTEDGKQKMDAFLASYKTVNSKLDAGS